jgi:hypothetical protein
MYNSFISIVSPVHPDINIVKMFLQGVSQELQKKFSDYEIILINCNFYPEQNLRESFSSMNPALLKDVSIYNFTRQIEIHNAIVGGLDNAHGDYVILLDMKFYQQTDLIEKLYLESQENFDIVCLKYKERRVSFMRKLLLKLFYNLIRRFSGMTLDYKTHSNRIISRRALNRLLTYRSDWNFLTGNLSEAGYPTSYLVTDIPPDAKEKSLHDEIRSAIPVLISRTTLLNKIFLYLFIFSLAFSFIVILNALMVRFSGHDLFGIPQEQVPGWAFLVVLLSINFNILLVILYFLYIYLTTIYAQVRRRPLYNIESIEKF